MVLAVMYMVPPLPMPPKPAPSERFSTMLLHNRALDQDDCSPYEESAPALALTAPFGKTSPPEGEALDGEDPGGSHMQDTELEFRAWWWF
jgi:hypothetical protein